MNFRYLFVALCSVVSLGVFTLFPSQPALSADLNDLNISGYGNAHYMDMSGMPTFERQESCPTNGGSGNCSVSNKDMNNGFAQLREFSLFIDATITDKLTASLEIEAADNGNQFTANYGYLQYDHSNFLKFRAGKILVPFLNYNENKPSFKQTLMSSPFTAASVAPVIGTMSGEFHGFGWSDVGVSGDYSKMINSFGGRGMINVKGAIINGLQSDTAVLDANTADLSSSGPVIRARDGLVQNEPELKGRNGNMALVGKLTYRSLGLPVEVGYSYYQGNWNSFNDDELKMHGVHAKWEAEDWMLKGEWTKADVEQTASDRTVGNSVVGGGRFVSTGDYDMDAWYVEGSYIPIRWKNQKFLRLIVRRDDVQTNDQASFSPWHRNRWTYGTEYQFAPQARLRYEFSKSELDDFDNAPGAFTNSGGEEKPEMHMASVIFWF